MHDTHPAAFDAEFVAALPHETPYFLFSETKLLARIREFSRHFPNVAIQYALKANSDPAVLRILADAGCGFEAASRYELRLLKAIGVPPEKIIYGTSVKSAPHIQEFAAYGVDCFACDCRTELEKIAANAPGSRVYVRLAVSDAGSVFKFSEKFGTDRTTAVSLLGLAASLGLRPYGLSFHVGSQSHNHRAWANALAELRDAMFALSQARIKLEILNLGGGFPCQYASTDTVPTLAEIGVEIFEQYRQLPYGYNPLRRVRDDKIPLAVSGLLETLKKMWPDAWGVRMEHVLRNTLYALLERNDAKLPDILRLYSDDDYRKEVVSDIRNEVVKRFWLNEFEEYPARLRAEACAPIQNKLGALLSDPTLYRILVDPEIDLRFRSLMDEGKVLLVNVAKGRLGEDSALILGGLVVSTLGLAAFSRAELSPDKRNPFFVYLDEFHNFTTLMLANMMSELRKYGVGLTLAHQHMHQLEPDIRHAVLGNAGTLISFRVGPDDASVLAKEFHPTFDVQDVLNLPNRNVLLKVMIDGTPSTPFSAEAMNTAGVERNGNETAIPSKPSGSTMQSDFLDVRSAP